MCSQTNTNLWPLSSQSCMCFGLLSDYVFFFFSFFFFFLLPFLFPSSSSSTFLSPSLTPSRLWRLFFLLWCLCGACHTPTPQQRRLLLASSSVSSVSKFSRAVTHPAPAPTSPARRTTTVRWWRWPSLKPSRPTCPTVTAPTAASTAEHTWPTMMSSSQRWANRFDGYRHECTQTSKQMPVCRKSLPVELGQGINPLNPEGLYVGLLSFSKVYIPQQNFCFLGLFSENMNDNTKNFFFPTHG